MGIVLFDFDGTITQRDTTRVLVFALIRARPWRIFHVLRPLFRLAVGGSEKQIQFAKHLCVGRLLVGLSDEKVQPVLVRYRNGVLPLVRPELAKLMCDRAAAGKQVLVVTASSELAVREALRDFPVTVLGARFEARRGMFTGAFEGDGCYGASKVSRIRAWADALATRPCFLEAWSDSLSDMPMMKLSENRVWVCKVSEQEKFFERDPEGKIYS